MARAVESDPAKRKDDSWSRRSASDKRLEGSLDKLDLTTAQLVSLSERMRRRTEKTEDILLFRVEIKLLSHASFSLRVEETDPRITNGL
jgi:hypothetical protein